MSKRTQSFPLLPLFFLMYARLFRCASCYQCRSSAKAKARARRLVAAEAAPLLMVPTTAQKTQKTKNGTRQDNTVTEFGSLRASCVHSSTSFFVYYDGGCEWVVVCVKCFFVLLRLVSITFGHAFVFIELCGLFVSLYSEVCLKSHD